MRPTHLVDASAWRQLWRPDIAARLVPLLVGGGGATCGVTDLAVLAGIGDPAERAEATVERTMFPRAPIDESVVGRALEVQIAVADVPIPALLVAAAAERADLVLLHDDAAYLRIAAFTGQALASI